MIKINKKEIVRNDKKQMRFLDRLSEQDVITVTTQKEYHRLSIALRKRYPVVMSGKFENIYIIKILPRENFRIVRKVAQTELYIKKLKFFDWYYPYSDDHSVWQRGNEGYNELVELQKELDVDYEIWNTYCPQERKRPLQNNLEAS